MRSVLNRADNSVVVTLKPEWLKIRPPSGEKYIMIKGLKEGLELHTVCEEAHCPNICECWGGGTATFMVMGDLCTRHCRFCAVKSGRPNGYLDPLEPVKLAYAIRRMNLRYVVVTSVDRDDLEDGGASHFAACIREIRRLNPSIYVEVLIPDFRGDVEALKRVVEARPNVVAHNIETVRRLTPIVRDPRAGYDQSLAVLENIKELDGGIYTKSSIMVGLGETKEEVVSAMRDLREVGVDFLTIGQYLQPSKGHIPVKEYVHPDVFEEYRLIGESLGFKYVASGPLVRSSYKAGEYFIMKNLATAQ
ncbi:lipoyl synthase [Candidatus Marsarchaeota G2 archaeon BE_D]|uniref:Lipoyl synthase n=1 Tax=Candidatus Marsarchaeota G2 archaeon BE_D TaxID=1978158 RepID=A0A2R6C8K3_9ARCH|nr:MAG: lipoyl synthase [Candidatus Marsarchaeota G2 archaeon BE_D]